VPTHRTLALDGARVHVAEEGRGSPVLLVHGFPETWTVFAGLIPHLAEHHRVHAVDLPGVGDSVADHEVGSEQLAAVLAQVVEVLDAGPVHLVGQDVSGAPTYRLAATRPDLVASWTAIETVLPGFGFEAVAGAAWYIGMLAAPGVPELLLPGRERGFLGDHVLAPQMVAAPDEGILDELARAYARTGFGAAAALYRSLLADGPAIQALATTPLTLPVLTVSGSAGDFVPTSVRNVAPGLEHVSLPGVGHYVALEAPGALAAALLPFLATGAAAAAVGTPARQAP
jgi:pimeloyl-ACP methyl ester carboxylesterase